MSQGLFFGSFIYKILIVLLQEIVVRGVSFIAMAVTVTDDNLQPKLDEIEQNLNDKVASIEQDRDAQLARVKQDAQQKIDDAKEEARKNREQVAYETSQDILDEADRRASQVQNSV